jgi:hypothetical protein
MHSVNIALNDGFEGGGLFYLKPSAIQDEETRDGRPVIPDKYRDYDWLSRQKRQNASNIVYPALGTGDLVVYNYTLYHGVAPVESGTRYSFVLFYDMDNPAIQEDFEIEDIAVTFYHEIEDADISLLWVDTTKSLEGETEMIEEKLLPFEEYPLVSYDGHVFRAVISGTDTVVSEFVMRDTQALYTINMEETSHSFLEDLLEPAFAQHRGVLPRSVCEELIALGEENGFIVEPESIDRYAPPKYKVSSQTIDVYERESELLYDISAILSPRDFSHMNNILLLLNACRRDNYPRDLGCTHTVDPKDYRFGKRIHQH